MKCSRAGVAAILLVLAVIVPVAAETPSAPARGAEPEVRRLERQWLDAYEQYDVTAMDRIVADDFLITFPDGSQQTKPQILAMLRRPRNPAQPPTRFRTENVQARVHGNTVILIGVVVSAYTRDGKPVEERSRYTDTYVRRNSRWQVVASGLSNWAAPRSAPRDSAKPAGISKSASRDSSMAPIGRITGNAVVSESPPMRIDVDRVLQPIGTVRFALKNVADVERHVFVHDDGRGRVRRMFIVQFESVKPGVKGGYSIEVTQPTPLGGHDYQTQTGLFDFDATARAQPGAEAERTRAFLAERDLNVTGDHFLVARYARVLDADQRREILLFAYENLREISMTRDEFEAGGRRASQTERILRDFETRARQRFQVTRP